MTSGRINRNVPCEARGLAEIAFEVWSTTSDRMSPNHQGSHQIPSCTADRRGGILMTLVAPCDRYDRDVPGESPSGASFALVTNTG